MAERAELTALLASGSARSYDGEAVTELEHALQTAQQAREAGADDDLVLAALVHDVGRIPGVCTGPHEQVRLVGLPERTAWLVSQHVAAKRWLVAVDPSYEISDVSRASLQRQGGPASAAEVERWRQHPWWADAVRLRRWDDLAKVPGLQVPGLEAYADLLRPPGPGAAAPR